MQVSLPLLSLFYEMEKVASKTGAPDLYGGRKGMYDTLQSLMDEDIERGTPAAEQTTLRKKNLFGHNSAFRNNIYKPMFQQMRSAEDAMKAYKANPTPETRAAVVEAVKKYKDTMMNYSGMRQGMHASGYAAERTADPLRQPGYRRMARINKAYTEPLSGFDNRMSERFSNMMKGVYGDAELTKALGPELQKLDNFQNSMNKTLDFAREGYGGVRERMPERAGAAAEGAGAGAAEGAAAGAEKPITESLAKNHAPGAAGGAKQPLMLENKTAPAGGAAPGEKPITESLMGNHAPGGPAAANAAANVDPAKVYQHAAGGGPANSVAEAAMKNRPAVGAAGGAAEAAAKGVGEAGGAMRAAEQAAGGAGKGMGLMARLGRGMKTMPKGGKWGLIGAAAGAGTAALANWLANRDR